MDGGNDQGQHCPWKPADAVILTVDPHDAAADEVKDMPVLETIVVGKTVFVA